MIGWNLIVCLNMIQFVKIILIKRQLQGDQDVNQGNSSQRTNGVLYNKGWWVAQETPLYILWTCLRLDIWYPQGMLGLFCRGILSDIQLYDFVVCLFEQNNIWGNWSIIKFQQGKGITTITTKKSHQWNACVCSALVVEMGRLWFLLK